jgi:simple sugar transport system permease protein
MGFTAIMATWLAAFNPLVMIGTCFFIIFISKGMVAVRGSFGFTNDSIANIVIGLVYFCVIACSFFITYRVVFRKRSAKKSKNDKSKGESKV